MPDEKTEQFKKSKRLILLIIFLVLLLLITAILYWLLGNLKQAQQPVTNVNTSLDKITEPLAQPQQPVFNNGDQNILSETQALTPDLVPLPTPTEQADILFTATAFAERFGSYSNQGEFSNLDDLEVFMTSSMSDWVKTYKQDLQIQYPDFNTYYAIETKAISKEVVALDEAAGTGEILVKTQRQEFENDIVNPRIFYQNIRLQITKVDNEWKINAAYWQ